MQHLYLRTVQVIYLEPNEFNSFLQLAIQCGIATEQHFEISMMKEDLEHLSDSPYYAELTSIVTEEFILLTSY